VGKSSDSDVPRLRRHLVVARRRMRRWRTIIPIAGIASMKKALPEKMFIDDQSRLSALRTWVLDQGVTEIEMSERQFWNFAGLQPLAEKPWVTFMGRQVRVPNMPEEAQKCLGVYDPQRPGVI
jgi:hypothetical protein